MTVSENHQQIVSIYQMLFDMARGTFTNRIPLHSHDDVLATISVLINMVAEEIQDNAFQMGYIRFKTRLEYHQFTVVLSQDLTIQNYTPEFSVFLGTDLLASDSVSILDFLTCTSKSKLLFLLSNNALQLSPLTLEFLTQKELAQSVFCYFQKFHTGTDSVLSLFVPCLSKNDLATLPNKDEERKCIVRKSDAVLIQKLYDYILAHLDEPLPSIPELARMFGTNESKLKEGFRYFFKTSIYQFYNEERLKRAFLMVQQTTIPFKTIAIMNGFTDYPNFSKSFKKQFGISPNEVVRHPIRSSSV